jgi:hypothetical protein
MRRPAITTVTSVPVHIISLVVLHARFRVTVVLYAYVPKRRLRPRARFRADVLLSDVVYDMATIFLSRRRGVGRVVRALALSCGLAIARVSGASAAPLDGAFPPPVVVVYPFTVSGSTTDAQAGDNVAVLLSTRLQTLGGMTVKPSAPGTARSDYLTAAQKENADYYVTGFLTPIGVEVSLITQVVSTYGGTIVWSNTSTIRTYNDALEQADGLRTAILAHAGRSLSSIGGQGPIATPQPSSSDAAGVNLTRALGRHRHDAPSPARTASAAPPAVVAAAVPERSGVLVTSVGGNASADLRDRASRALTSEIRKVGARAANLPVSGSDAIANAASICAANPGYATLVVGSLAVGPVGADSANPGTLAFDVTKYDCTGHEVARGHAALALGKRTSPSAAIDADAARVVSALKSATPFAP